MTITQIFIIAIIVLIICLYLFWLVKKDGLKATSIRLIVEAEKSLNDNKEKMDYCVNKLIALIPLPFSLFITDTMVEKIIQSVFDQVKQALDYVPEQEVKDGTK